MSDIRKPGPKFPPTRHLDACYGDIVPNDYINYETVETLDSLLCGKVGGVSVVSDSPILPPDDQLTPSEHAHALQAKLVDQISQLQRSIYLQEQVIQQSLPSLRTLISAAKSNAAVTASNLSCCTLATPTLSRVRRRGILKCCKCSCKVLPFTRFCLEHIHLARSQFLYRSCSAPDHLTKTTCNLPVRDILSIESACHKHVRLMDVGGVNKLSLPARKPGARGMVGKMGGQAVGSRIRGGKQAGSKISPRVKKLHTGAVLIKPIKEDNIQPHVKEDAPGYLQTVIKEEPPGNIQASSREDVPGAKVSSATGDRASLDDLLTLGAPLPTLDLPPLEADLGDIMMAGEESSDEG